MIIDTNLVRRLPREDRRALLRLLLDECGVAQEEADEATGQPLCTLADGTAVFFRGAAWGAEMAGLPVRVELALGDSTTRTYYPSADPDAVARAGLVLRNLEAGVVTKLVEWGVGRGVLDAVLDTVCRHTEKVRNILATSEPR